MQTLGSGEVNRWKFNLQKIKNEKTSTQTDLAALECEVPPVTPEEETKKNLPADDQSQNTSLVTTSDEKNAQTTQNNVSTTVEQQEPEANVDD